MGNYFGVGVRTKTVSALSEFLAQLSKVLNNAVMNNRNIIRTTGVGMSISFTRRAMRCPARVTNTTKTFTILFPNSSNKLRNFT